MLKENNRRFVFFLGGQDLEMGTIRDLLHSENAKVVDKKLSWGAKASDYEPELRAALAAGEQPILLELTLDLDLPAGIIVVVDHHGSRAGVYKPTSLHQVFALLELPASRWTRWYDLVAANDRGHVRGMLALDPPATHEELVEVRARDRSAQGVTADQEAEAASAIRSRRLMADGKLTIIDVPHNRFSAVTDAMVTELGGPGFESLLVIGPNEIQFEGPWDSVEKLNGAFPGGWTGGAKPIRGFWGHKLPTDRMKLDKEAVCLALNLK